MDGRRSSSIGADYRVHSRSRESLDAVGLLAVRIPVHPSLGPSAQLVASRIVFIRNETTARTRKPKKRIRAIPSALDAIPPNPNIAAISATTKNASAHLNISASRNNSPERPRVVRRRASVVPTAETGTRRRPPGIPRHVEQRGKLLRPWRKWRARLSSKRGGAGLRTGTHVAAANLS